MKSDPKVVAKLAAQVKDAKKNFEAAAKQVEKTAADCEAALASFTKALAKLKLDGPIKEADFNAMAKTSGTLQKALVTSGKANISLESGRDAVFIAAGDLLNAQEGK